MKNQSNQFANLEGVFRVKREKKNDQRTYPACRSGQKGHDTTGVKDFKILARSARKEKTKMTRSKGREERRNRDEDTGSLQRWGKVGKRGTLRTGEKEKPGKKEKYLRKQWGPPQ